jgi:aspartate kinase
MNENGNQIRIFKFGGASVKSAQGVRNLATIVKNHKGRLLVVVSAMGKTTNALERILAGFFNRDGGFQSEFLQLKNFHLDIAEDLFNGKNETVINRLHEVFSNIEEYLYHTEPSDYNFNYDQLVSSGEILSSIIVSEYLNYVNLKNQWVDVRLALRTDENFREGNVDYDVSAEQCHKIFDFGDTSLYVTQGFIAGTQTGTTTTLGREGSDFTAAVLANLLDASDVTIWKDVEGVLNADPRIFSNTVRLDTVSFKEAIELAYCGAQILHPKTIKPLQNKKIPLLVKSFINPNGAGTRVIEADARIEFPPILILKPNQVLISLTPKDFSFVIEDCLSKIFATLFKHRVKANLVQNSAISFSICVDNEEHFLPGAIQELRREFSVRYNKNLKLLTVRHYTQDTIERLTHGKTIFLEQKTRSTARYILDEVNETLP